MDTPELDPLEKQIRRLEWQVKHRDKVLHNIFLLALHAECACETQDLCPHEAEAFFAAIRTMAEMES